MRHNKFSGVTRSAPGLRARDDSLQKVPKKWISTAEACRLTGFSPDSLKRFAVSDDSFPPPARFANALRYDAQALDNWMRGRVRRPSTPKALKPQVERLIARMRARGIEMTRSEAEAILRAR